jgi:hypothetical protein
MINGQYFSWEHITIRLFGETLYDVESIEWEDSQKINLVKGKGRKARGYTTGEITATAKLTMRREEYERMLNNREIKQKGLYGIKPFPLTCAYDKGDGKVSTDVLNDCLFEKRKSSGAEVDTEGAMIELDLMVLGGVTSDDVPDLVE